MKMLENLLFATDLGPSSVGAERLAATLSRTFGSSVHVVHVLPDLVEGIDPGTLERAVDESLYELHTRLVDAGAMVASTRVDRGLPFAHIEALADDVDANVVLVGRAETGGMGVTAGRLIRSCDRPVWSVSSEHRGHVDRILCPVDFSKASERALRNAIHLARQLTAHLTIVHVAEPAETRYPFLTRLTGERTPSGLEVPRHSLRTFLERFDLSGVSRSSDVRQGRVDEVIVGLASEVAADVIVMGAGGATMSPNLVGGAAERVLRGARGSVVMMKDEDAIRLRVDAQLNDLLAAHAQGRRLLDGGFPDDAVRVLSRLVGRDPSFAPAWELLAEAQHRLGRTSEAEACRVRARHLQEVLWRSEAATRTERALRSGG